MEQKWEYEVANIKIFSDRDEDIDVILPARLVGMPAENLAIEMPLYMRLGKEEMQNIRAQNLEIFVPIEDTTDRQKLESDTAQKNREEVRNSNEGVSRLNVFYEVRHSTRTKR